MPAMRSLAHCNIKSGVRSPMYSCEAAPPLSKQDEKGNHVMQVELEKWQNRKARRGYMKSLRVG